jgi:hypothetical protein
MEIADAQNAHDFMEGKPSHCRSVAVRGGTREDRPRPGIAFAAGAPSKLLTSGLSLARDAAAIVVQAIELHAGEATRARDVAVRGGPKLRPAGTGD